MTKGAPAAGAAMADAGSLSRARRSLTCALCRHGASPPRHRPLSLASRGTLSAPARCLAPSP
eukprot:scaffold35290_cov54-Isochrysis_galbana.AAC.2